MNEQLPPLNTSQIRVWPLAERRSLSELGRILVRVDGAPPVVEDRLLRQIQQCAAAIARARATGASVILMYGAHLVKNGALDIVNALVNGGWITHLATNGAGVIHDWELAFLGRTEESVRENVAQGRFGTWDETGRAVNLSVLAGGLRGEGFGRSVGRFICEDGVTLPQREDLEAALRSEPGCALSPARAELLCAMTAFGLGAGRLEFRHPNQAHSILANAFAKGVPLTVHPGIGYDIYVNHPWFNGAAVGRAAAQDYRVLGGAVERLDGGVVLSVGSAIMAPQVFEKSLSAVNNLRLQEGRPVVRNHSIYVVDIQDGGNWDWSTCEPPKDNPAYYLRFCKTYARMGGAMNYLQVDNVAFLHNLLGELNSGKGKL